MSSEEPVDKQKIDKTDKIDQIEIQISTELHQKFWKLQNRFIVTINKILFPFLREIKVGKIT